MGSVHVSQSLSSHPLYTNATPEQQALLAADVARAVANGLNESDVVSAYDSWVELGAQEYLDSLPAAEGGKPLPEQGEEQAAEQEAAQRAEASATLKQCVNAYRKGEKAMRAGWLEAGRLADVYLHQRLALGDKRAPVVKTLEGKLNEYASTTVVANDLIATYHAYRLLAEETGLATVPEKGKAAPADRVAYGHYRDAWRNLVQRQGKDTAEECWVLLPGVEQEARDLFSRACKDGLSKQAVTEQVKALQARWATLQAVATQQAAAEAEAKAKAESVEAAKALEQRQKAEQAARTLEVAAQKAATEQNAEEAARVAEQAAKAKADLEAKQRAEREAHARAEQAAREQRQAEEAAKAAAEKDRKAAEQQTKQATKQASKAGPVAPVKPLQSTDAPANPLESIHAGLEKATDHDAAELLASLLLEHTKNPAKVLPLLLEQVVKAEAMPGKLHGALITLLKGLEAKSAGTPSANGTPAAVAA